MILSVQSLVLGPLWELPNNVQNQETERTGETQGKQLTLLKHITQVCSSLKSNAARESCNSSKPLTMNARYLRPISLSIFGVSESINGCNRQFPLRGLELAQGDSNLQSGKYGVKSARRDDDIDAPTFPSKTSLRWEANGQTAAAIVSCLSDRELLSVDPGAPILQTRVSAGLLRVVVSKETRCRVRLASSGSAIW